MEIVACHDARLSPVVGPGDVVQLAVLGVSDFVAIDHHAHTVHVGRASQLVPCVVGQMVAVGILAHHHDARLAAPGVGIAADVDVHLTRHVGHGMVEVEGDVAAKGTQRYHLPCSARQPLGALGHHRLRGVAFVGLRERVDKLSRRRHVLIDSLDVARLRPCGAK